jgi:hypothetical protein
LTLLQVTRSHRTHTPTINTLSCISSIDSSLTPAPLCCIEGILAVPLEVKRYGNKDDQDDDLLPQDSDATLDAAPEPDTALEPKAKEEVQKVHRSPPSNAGRRHGENTQQIPASSAQLLSSSWYITAASSQDSSRWTDIPKPAKPRISRTLFRYGDACVPTPSCPFSTMPHNIQDVTDYHAHAKNRAFVKCRYCNIAPWLMVGN